MYDLIQRLIRSIVGKCNGDELIDIIISHVTHTEEK